MLKNPFNVYILSFGAVFAVYKLAWSEVYPPLSVDLLFFFGLTFVCAILFGVAVSGKLKAVRSYQPKLLPNFTVFLLIAGFAADLWFTGIPLLSVLGGDPYSGDIGVPTLHVFNVTFGGAFSVIRYADYLYSKRPRYLLEAVLPLVFFVLVVYRGPVLICLVAWFFVFIIKNGLGIKRSLVIGGMSLLILHLFGLIGNLREGATTAIEHLGQPTIKFQESGVPPTFFWTYIYLSSPMANLQLNVDTERRENRGALEFVVTEVLPDVISKRIMEGLGTERVKPDEVSEGLTVSTLYGRAYVLAGWIGAGVLFVVLCAFIFVYLRLILASPYSVPCLALLNTLVFFCTFQNMIAFSGVILQLFWPLLYHAIVRRTYRIVRLARTGDVVVRRRPRHHCHS